MVNPLLKDYNWIIEGDLNMTERPNDKSNDCGRTINDLEMFIWNDFLNGLQFHNSFVYQGSPQISWNNGQKGEDKSACKT